VETFVQGSSPALLRGTVVALDWRILKNHQNWIQHHSWISRDIWVKS